MLVFASGSGIPRVSDYPGRTQDQSAACPRCSGGPATKRCEGSPEIFGPSLIWFIQSFAKISQPLHTLTRKNAQFKWTEKCQQSFDDLKGRLSTAPVLAYPNFQQRFIVETDASIQGLGSVLSQCPMVVPSFQQWDQGDWDQGKRMLVLMLFSAAHVPLLQPKALLRLKHKCCCVRRMILSMQLFALDPEQDTPVTGFSLKEGQEKDMKLHEIRDYLCSGALPQDDKQARKLVVQAQLFTVVNDVLYYLDPHWKNQRRAVVPNHLKRTVMENNHGGPFGGHFTGNRLFKMLAWNWWWDGMYKDCINCCRSCPNCTFVSVGGKLRKPPPKAHPSLMPIPDPWNWHHENAKDK